MKKILIFTISLLLAICSNVFVSYSEAAVMDTNLINVKTDLDNLYYKANANKKLSKKELAKLNNLKIALDGNIRNSNSNVVPLYYKMGNIYKAINMDAEAIQCYRTILNYFPTSPLRKKVLIKLKYCGETYTDKYGKTILYPEYEE